MAGSINKVILVGNLGADPDVRTTQDGREIANLSLATSESWKDKNTGERRDKTEWHRVVIFQPSLVGIAKQYLKKGSKIFLEGSLQTRKWTDNNGQDRYTTEIVIQGYNGGFTMLDSAGSAGGAGNFGDNNFSGGNPMGATNNRPAQPAQAPAAAAPASNVAEDFEDDIPF